MEAVARTGASRSVPQLSLPSWLHPLLLLMAPFHTTQFHYSKIAAIGTHQGAWPFVQLLPKVSLQVKFYQAILGCSQVSIPCSTSTNHSCRNGEDCKGFP